MRQITQSDAPALAQLIRATGLDDNPDPERIARVSLESNHVTLVETAVDGALIGFVDAFSTISQNGTLRWEVDLLGVHPDHRGRGVAQSLIHEALQRGKGAGLTEARALVHIENAASANAFQRCGFSLDDLMQQLFISDQSVAEMGPIPPDAYLLAVSTLTYQGVWVEGILSAAALRCAQAVCTRCGWNVAGVVLRAEDETAKSAGYEFVGSYRWLRTML